MAGRIMRQYRIVAESGRDGTFYKVQSKGSGPLSFFWRDEGEALSLDCYVTAWHDSQQEAEEAVLDLMRPRLRLSTIVKTYGCGDA